MTPQEALDLLDQAAAVATGNREVHDKIKEAVTVLQRLIYRPRGETAVFRVGRRW